MICTICLLCIVFSSKAQGISYEETINYLNKKYAGKVVFKDKKKDLLITFYKGGELYRQDKVNLLAIDPDSGVSYNSEEKRIIVKCKESMQDCVYRKIVKIKAVDNYSRIALSSEGQTDKGIEGIKNALIHLLKLTYYSDHSRDEPFE